MAPISGRKPTKPEKSHKPGAPIRNPDHLDEIGSTTPRTHHERRTRTTSKNGKKTQITPPRGGKTAFRWPGKFKIPKLLKLQIFFMKFQLFKISQKLDSIPEQFPSSKQLRSCEGFREGPHDEGFPLNHFSAPGREKPLKSGKNK